MSANSSSSSHDYFLYPNHCSNETFHFKDCFFTRPSSFILSTLFLTYSLLLLPLSIFITHHGLKQWKQKRSTSSAAAMSHSDCFTYNMVAMELIGVFGCILCCCGIYSDHSNIFLFGLSLYSFTWFGQMFIHVLTCVERYLAVVHPITYLSLRKERGIRIRNISMGCVWLLCILDTSLMIIDDIYNVLNLCLMTVSLTIVSFCSLSVLRVLIRPGPGKQGGGRERVDQSKQRAFYTIMVILGVLVLRFFADLAWSVVYVWKECSDCMATVLDFWSNLPSSLVLPLLFLNRAGKLVCCKKNIQ